MFFLDKLKVKKMVCGDVAENSKKKKKKKRGTYNGVMK